MLMIVVIEFQSAATVYRVAAQRSTVFLGADTVSNLRILSRKRSLIQCGAALLKQHPQQAIPFSLLSVPVSSSMGWTLLGHSQPQQWMHMDCVRVHGRVYGSRDV